MESTRPLSRFEQGLLLLTTVEPGDGRRVAALGLQALALMVAYYLLRPVREALILTQGSAELRSYAVGLQACVLLPLVPLYGALVRKVGARRVLGVLALHAAAQLALFCGLGLAGFAVGFAFFAWVGIFGVLMVSQFWALATDLLTVESGQRLFGVIAAAVAGGAWLGARIASACFAILGPYGLMLLSAALLCTAALASRWVVACAAPRIAHAAPPLRDPGARRADRLLGGFAFIARSPYLAGIAALVVLLNWITSTGEFVLSGWLVEFARAQAPGAEAAFIGAFMGRYGASIALLGFLVQLLVVSRTIRFAGLARALLVTPVAFVAGFLLIGALPAFAVLQCVLITQKSLDYSLFNTTRSALLLPTDRDAKFQAKTTIDTVFYRLGDLLSTLSVFVGVRVLTASRAEFLALVLALSVGLTLAAWRVGREYSRRAAAYHRDCSPQGPLDDDDGREDRAPGQPALSRPAAGRARADRRAGRATPLPQRRDRLLAG
ncbi:MAG: NTP/NDP exchange transporter [Steroidobacteraceae bacterium]